MSFRPDLRSCILALLVAAQLCTAAHAVDHGPGEHDHGGVICQYGMTGDDDVVVPLSRVTPAPVTDVQCVCRATAVAILARSATLLPPSTGPPLSS